ncbi:hypothetical protein DY000_02054054 [Brassica cretica]|uniref:Uncharacterized protein n=1 Tax=Brassica cretica TaxID=69181 RepID=A0ABQ7A4X0_BRACR|nr:hypothetical protein DY000_02054054 [Brassica cretica]
MAQDDATFGAPGGEPTPTPEAAPSDFMSSAMARLARHDEVQKTTNDQLTALVAALTDPNGQTSRPQMIRRRLFNTNPTATGGDHISDESEPNETLLTDAPPIGPDLATIRDIAELKLSFQQMSSKIHQATSAAPKIESILAATSRTPFTSALTNGIAKDQSLRDLVSRIEIPDDIAIDALRNTLWVRSKFQEDLYQNPTTSLQDAITRSDNFIRMEEDTNAILSKMNAPKAPVTKNANTRQEPRQHAPSDKNSRKDGYMYIVNENNVSVPTMVVRGEGWNKWVRELDSSGELTDTVCATQPADDGEEDSSADEEQPANRRCIEVILSQQTLSSDDENDDTPILGDLRDVLKRKLESEDDNSSEYSDLRLTLNARKSHRISTGDPEPKKHPKRPNGDLRDKLNAGACDLRILLNRSKPTDLRRREWSLWAFISFSISWTASTCWFFLEERSQTVHKITYRRSKAPGSEELHPGPYTRPPRTKAQRGPKLGHQGEEADKGGEGNRKKGIDTLHTHTLSS